jgi:hypothetical protein
MSRDGLDESQDGIQHELQAVIELLLKFAQRTDIALDGAESPMYLRVDPCGRRIAQVNDDSRYAEHSRADLGNLTWHQAYFQKCPPQLGTRLARIGEYLC